MKSKSKKKQTKLCKITVFLLLLFVLVTSFSGCAAESDEALLETAKELLSASILVNEMLFGEGIDYCEDGYGTGGYKQAKEESLAAFGVKSVADIRAKVAAVYSISACDWINTVVLSPVKTDNLVLSYSRYYDSTVPDGEGGEIPVLMVKKDYEPYQVGTPRYENVRLVSHARTRAEIAVDIVVEKDGEVTSYDGVALTMRKEDGVWKFDTLTYASAK